MQVSTIIPKNQPLFCKVKFGDSGVLDFDQKTFKSQLEQVNGFKWSGINDRPGYFCQKVILQGMCRILFFQTETDAGYLHLISKPYNDQEIPFYNSVRDVSVKVFGTSLW